MLDSFLTIASQVLMLFLLMGVGFVLGKLNMLSSAATSAMSTLILYIATPAITIVNFQRDLDADGLKGLGMTVLLAAIVQVIVILCSRVMIHHKDEDRQIIMRYASNYGNVIYMGYPLFLSILGSIGIFYGCAYSIVFTLSTWTYGLYCMSKDWHGFNWKKIVYNPGIVGSLLALGLYLLQIRLPNLLVTPMTYLGNLNTPLPMIIMGYQLSKADLRSVVRGLDFWMSTTISLIISPLAALALCLLFKTDYAISMVVVIASAAPPAVVTSMMAELCGRDTAISSSTVTAQTLVSIVTMPLVAGLASILLV